MGEDLKIYIAIPTVGRPQNMANLCQFLWKPAHFYVTPRESKIYHRALRSTDHKIHTVQRKGHFSETLNMMVEDGQARGAWTVLLDDDLRWIKMWSPNHEDHIEQSLRTAVRVMIDGMKDLDCGYGGVPPTDNKMFSRNGFAAHGPWRVFRGFCRNSFSIIAPDNELRFDEHLVTKMDYDFSLQNIRAYGGTCRCDGTIASFGYNQKEGGFSQIRNPRIEQRSIRRLVKKWGDDIIRLNTNRPNEIILRVPRDW